MEDNANSIKENQNPEAVTQRYLDMTNSCSLEQSVYEPTRDDNILDIYLTNRPSLLNKCTTMPGLGGHNAVLLILK